MKFKSTFVKSDKLHSMFLEQMAKQNERNANTDKGHQYNVNVQYYIKGILTVRVPHTFGYFYGEEAQDSVKIEKCKRRTAAKDFPDDDEFVEYHDTNEKGQLLLFIFPGSPEAVEFAVKQAFFETEIEEKMSKLLSRPDLKGDVHKFLASRAVFCKRGGKFKAYEEVRHFADGYIAAWQKFGGRSHHPRPYVLSPTYGSNKQSAAYLFTMPPEQILEEVENAFAAHIVMSS